MSLRTWLCVTELTSQLFASRNPPLIRGETLPVDLSLRRGTFVVANAPVVREHARVDLRPDERRRGGVCEVDHARAEPAKDVPAEMAHSVVHQAWAS